MKKINLLLAGLMVFVFFATKVQAQTAPGTIAGKWDVLAKGLPTGDTHIFFTIVEKDGAYSGTMQDIETKKDVPLDKVEKTEKGFTIHFTAQNMDIPVVLEKKDEDHVSGMLYGMFECTGERVKQ